MTISYIIRHNHTQPIFQCGFSPVAYIYATVVCYNVYMSFTYSSHEFLLYRKSLPCRNFELCEVTITIQHKYPFANKDWYKKVVTEPIL